MVNIYARKRAIYLASRGLNPAQISRVLATEGISYSRVSVWYLLKKFAASGSEARKSGSGKHSKITQTVNNIVENQMQKDDETTASELVQLLQEEGIHLSRSSIL